MKASACHAVILCLAATLAFTGCNGERPKAIVPEIYDKTVYCMGTLDGSLSGEIDGAFTLTPYDAQKAVEAPVFIPGVLITSLNEGQREALRGIFFSLHPILLVNAIQSDIAELNAILETGLDFALPDDCDYIEVYALDFEENGNLFQWHQYAPALSDTEEDTAENRILRVNMLVEWMEQNGMRTQTEGAKAAAEDFKARNYVDLVTQSYCFTDQFNRTGGYRAKFQITHYIYACHSTVTNRDWFYVRQEFATDFSSAYRRSNYLWDIGMPFDEAGPYLDSISTKAFVVGCLSNVDLVDMSQTYPPTTSSGGMLSNSVDYYIPEQVLYDANGATGIGAEGGVFVQSSKFDASGFSVENQCFSEVSNAQWKYQVNRCSAYNWFLYAQLTDVPSQASSTFKPVNQWVWQMSPAAQAGVPKMAVDYETTGVTSKGKVIIPFLAETQHEQTGRIAGTYYVSLPYPPTTTE